MIDNHAQDPVIERTRTVENVVLGIPNEPALVRTVLLRAPVRGNPLAQSPLESHLRVGHLPAVEEVELGPLIHVFFGVDSDPDWRVIIDAIVHPIGKGAETSDGSGSLDGKIAVKRKNKINN